ncbi:MAG: tetratricopeptide repeat protein [Planctomycetes bacterium]|nr:tetratricopeptide repeat protein [Planctomycetota bacterium]
MRPRARSGRLTASAAALVLLAATAAAQPELDWGVAEARLVAGEYARAAAEYRAELAKNPGSAADRFGLALTLFETGGYDEAHALLDGLVADHPGVAAYRLRRAELDRLRGRFEPAEQAWRAILDTDPDHFEARARLGQLCLWRGQTAAAANHFRVPERVASRRVITTAEELLYLGGCYEGLGRLADASAVYLEALQHKEHGDPEFYPAYVSLIALYLKTHHIHGARPSYMPVRDEALRRNPHHPDIHLVLADVYLARLEHSRAREALDKALAVNPNRVHGRCLEAYFAIDRMDFAAARTALAHARRIDPTDKETAAYAASLDHIEGRPEAAARAFEALLAVDPGYGEGFYLLAELLGNLRRYQEARRFAERAVEVDPKLWKAWDSLARFALHVGEETRALQALRRARDGDPFGTFHPWRHNMLELYSHMDEFLVHEWGPFRVRLHAEDSPVLRRYIRETLEAALRELSAKYEFAPAGPIRVEIFSKGKDFAVRTVGVPGIYGVLGACFGQVITMNSPRALPLGSYVWSATLWHEFAHVITLQMSDYRVSRWLTEGLSVYEEKCKNPAWEDTEDVALLTALDNGAVVPVRELDGLFRTPRIAFAYLQSLHLVEFIIARKGGFKKLPEMLRRYARGRSTAEVVEECLGLGLEALDREFLDYLQERFAGQRIRTPISLERYEEARAVLDLDGANLDALRTVAWYLFQQGPERTVDCEVALGRLLGRRPDDASGLALRGELALRKREPTKAKQYLERARAAGHEEFFLRLHLARLAELGGAGGIEEAIAHLEAAKALFPRYTGPESPHLKLARLHEQRGDADAARAEIEAFVKLEATDIDSRLLLADHYLAAGQAETALTYLEETNQVNPFSAAIHRRMAAGLVALERYPQALEELDLAILLTEEGKGAAPGAKSSLADLRLERARILRTMGRREQATAEAEAALKESPDHAGLKAFLAEEGGSRGD